MAKEAVTGMAALQKKLSAMGADAAPIMRKGVKKGLKRIQASAKLLCPADSGELRESIKTRTKIKETQVIGEVYTNKEYAAPVEFGAGPIGEQTLQEIPEGLNITHSQTGWWIHVGDGEKDIPLKTVEKYHLFTITREDGEMFAYSHGSPAQPFLYPAIEGNRERVITDVAKTVQAEIVKKVRKSD